MFHVEHFGLSKKDQSQQNRKRGVGDAAPYKRQLVFSIGISSQIFTLYAAL